MSYPPGPYPGQPDDGQPKNWPADGQQDSGYSQADPTRLNPVSQPDPTQLNPVNQPAPTQLNPMHQADPTQLNPVNQPAPTQLNPMHQADPTQLNPMGQPDPAYPPGQPYGPGQPYDPNAQQYPPQYFPQGGGYPPPGQPYPPPPGPPFPPGPGYPQQYGPGGPGSGGGGGGKVAAIVGSILVTGLVIAGGIGFKLLKSADKGDDTDASGAVTTSAAATTTSGRSLPTTSARTTSPTTTTPAKPATLWIAATYNEGAKEVHWARSSVSKEVAAAQVLTACGSTCQEPVWSKDGCVAFAFGQNNGWGSAWGLTIAEAQNTAMTTAQNDWNVRGPFEFWSKCAQE